MDGLMNLMNDPRAAGLLGLAGGLLNAGAPKPYKVGLGEAVGSGMGGLMSGMMGAQRARQDDRMDSLMEASMYRLLGLPMPPEMQQRLGVMYGQQPQQPQGMPTPAAGLVPPPSNILRLTGGLY